MMRSYIDLHTFIWLFEVIADQLRQKGLQCHMWNCNNFFNLLRKCALRQSLSRAKELPAAMPAEYGWMVGLRLCCGNNLTYVIVNLIIPTHTHAHTQLTFTDLQQRPLATGRCIIQPKSLLRRAHNGAVMKDWCVKNSLVGLCYVKQLNSGWKMGV